MGWIIVITENWVAINKPAGLSLATPRHAPEAAQERLRKSLGEEERQLLTGPLYLVHRLDVATTGLTLLARNQATHQRLAGAFSRGEVHRTYLALVWGKVRPQEGLWDEPLGPFKADRRKMWPTPEGKPSLTLYRRLQYRAPVSLLLLTPKTGRTHQLRVHAAASGHPIVGDDLYAGPRFRGVRDLALRKALRVPHLLLHAWRLQLPLALGGFTLEAPLPEAFASVLQALAFPWPPAGAEASFQALVASSLQASSQKKP